MHCFASVRSDASDGMRGPSSAWRRLRPSLWQWLVRGPGTAAEDMGGREGWVGGMGPSALAPPPPVPFVGLPTAVVGAGGPVAVCGLSDGRCGAVVGDPLRRLGTDRWRLGAKGHLCGPPRPLWATCRRLRVKRRRLWAS